ncbi:OmpA family protein [Paraburkholderia sp. C35]|uniref:OmpA family protein n=1 Tax=Paraburkholderia sp. C35 TaxID=2126993 RepID=UPI000D69AEDB|nr:OmpA family protein [Paraburkholderia sp. C35]
MTIRSPIALGVALCVSGCAINPQTGQPEVAASVKTQFNSIFNSEDPCSNNDRNIGIAVGVVAGGVIGYLADGAKGAVAGAAIGAGGGFLVGHALDARRCELYRIAQANGLKLASAPITQGKPNAGSADKPTTVGLDVQLENKSDEFVAGSAELTPQARKYLSQIANQYSPKTLMAALPPDATAEQRAQASGRKVLIVGHTDENDSSLGVDVASLSQQRAKAVAKVFADQGVPVQNIFYQGAGDTLPVAPNGTDQGREENQRVQIVDVPTEADLQQFLSARTADPANYRFANASTTSIQEPSSVARKNSVASASPDHSATAKQPAKPRSKPVAVAKSNNAASAKTETNADQSAASNGTAAVAPQQQTTVTASDAGASGYNFGGTPTAGSGIPVRLGSSPARSSFSLISNANAGAPMTLNSCLGDRPHVASAVRNLATGQVLNVRDYLPGFYGAPWAAGMGGNLVALLDVRVPSDAGSPVPQPELKIYKDYTGNVSQKPSYSARVPVNVYRGSDATLYRVFVDGPMQCMDLVVPLSKPRATGNVYYTNRSVDYTASGNFALR